MLSHEFAAGVAKRAGWDVSEVEKLTLQRENIERLGSAFRGFSSLVELDLSRNKIACLRGLETLPSLQSLSLYFNRVEDLREILRLCRSPLVSLDMRLNPVARCDSYRGFTVFHLPQLASLDDRAVTAADIQRANAVAAAGMLPQLSVGESSESEASDAGGAPPPLPSPSPPRPAAAAAPASPIPPSPLRASAPLSASPAPRPAPVDLQASVDLLQELGLSSGQIAGLAARLMAEQEGEEPIGRQELGLSSGQIAGLAARLTAEQEGEEPIGRQQMRRSRKESERRHSRSRSRSRGSSSSSSSSDTDSDASRRRRRRHRRRHRRHHHHRHRRSESPSPSPASPLQKHLQRVRAREEEEQQQQQQQPAERLLSDHSSSDSDSEPNAVPPRAASPLRSPHVAPAPPSPADVDPAVRGAVSSILSVVVQELDAASTPSAPGSVAVLRQRLVPILQQALSSGPLTQQQRDSVLPTGHDHATALALADEAAALRAASEAQTAELRLKERQVQQLQLVVAEQKEMLHEERDSWARKTEAGAEALGMLKEAHKALLQSNRRLLAQVDEEKSRHAAEAQQSQQNFESLRAHYEARLAAAGLP